MGFFDKVRESKIVYFDDKYLYELFKTLEVRNNFTGISLCEIAEKISFSTFIFNYIEEYMKYMESDENDVEKEHFALQPSFYEYVVGLTLLIKYFYPIIEQLDKLVDDKFKFEKNEKSNNV